MALLSAGCAKPADESASSKSAVDPAIRDLKIALRDSENDRSQRIALADQAAILETAADAFEARLTSVAGYRWIPVVEDPSQDVPKLQGALEVLLQTLKIPGTVRISTGPRAIAVPKRISDRTPFSYSEAQVLGAHRIELRLQRGAPQPESIARLLPGLGRLVTFDSAKRLADGSLSLVGQALYFRDVDPIEVYRDLTEPEVLRMDLEGRGAAVEAMVAQIRANYRAVEAVDEALVRAFSARGRLLFANARYTAFSRQIDRFNAMDLPGLIRSATTDP